MWVGAPCGWSAKSEHSLANYRCRVVQVGATPEPSAHCPYVPALLAQGTGRRQGRLPAWDAR
jgi:hypothetical protein